MAGISFSNFSAYAAASLSFIIFAVLQRGFVDSNTAHEINITDMIFQRKPA
jgi:hypothetical protein